MINNTEYVRFGSGPQNLVLLPGLGDSLRSMKGTALPLAFMYRKFAGDFTVYVFSRKSDLKEGATTEDMAADLKAAMEALHIEKASFVGVSMGGMLAQHFAADYPEMVDKLVLVVTSARPNDILNEAVGEWAELARRGDHSAFMESNLRRIYSEDYYRKNKWLIPVLGKLTRPKSYDRFFIMAEACLEHNAYDKLERITSPTLVVGGEKDICLGGDASREIAGAIRGSRLHMYKQWGHGLYEEAKDF
ncbi:MAG: alpha/beta hydrolase, partial [Firmicutes bacterium]|nr:alpha/beta hydrolase [Bacillota bacterium]